MSSNKIPDGGEINVSLTFEEFVALFEASGARINSALLMLLQRAHEAMFGLRLGPGYLRWNEHSGARIAHGRAVQGLFVAVLTDGSALAIPVASIIEFQGDAPRSHNAG